MLQSALSVSQCLSVRLLQCNGSSTVEPDDGLYEKPKHVAEAFKNTSFVPLLLLSFMYKHTAG
jgi:hypothetical protein